MTILALNLDRKAARTFTVSGDSERYTLSARNLEGTEVQMNGHPLKLGDNDFLPELRGVPAHSGQISLPPASITFLVFRQAHNKSCA